MAQQRRGNGVLDVAWSTIAFRNQNPYALLWHSQDRSASRSGTDRPAYCIEGRVRLCTRRGHNPFQLHVAESRGSITGSYRDHDAAVFDTSALETMRLASAPLIEFQLPHPSYTSWPTMSINGTTTEPRPTYKEMAELVVLVKRVLASAAAKSSVEPPEQAHFFHPSNDPFNVSPGSDSILSYEDIDRAHRYNQPARPGEFIFRELLLGRRRKLIRIVSRNAPRVMTEVQHFLNDPDDPNPRSVWLKVSYLMGDSYVDIGPVGERENFLVTAQGLWKRVTTWAGRTKDTAKATLLEMQDKVLECVYGPTNDAEVGWENVFV
jgi:hypothetical protein